MKSFSWNQLGDWSEGWQGKLTSGWVGLVIATIVAIVARRIISSYLAKMLQKLSSRFNIELSDEQSSKATYPMGTAISVYLWQLVLPLLELGPGVLSGCLGVSKIVFEVLVTVSAYRTIEVMQICLEKRALESASKLDDIFTPWICNTCKFIVVAVGIVFIGNSLNLDMKSIVAGLGLGGLAAALAAKDTISNIFGSLTILLDRPFALGDWVVINKSVEGTVETVGARSCRIRTFYDSLVTIPNGELTNAHIDNYGQRKYRRLSTTISIAYDTPADKIEEFCEGVRHIVAGHKWTRKDYFNVYLNNFGDSALEIMLYVFWEVPDWSKELAERHRLLLDILRLGRKMDVQFAFPTQTLHMINDQFATHAPTTENFGSQKAKDILSSPMTKA